MSTTYEAVLILYFSPDEYVPLRSISCDSQDSVLDEVKAVTRALQNLKIRVRSESITQLQDLPRILAESAERIVFNLIEDFPDRPFHATYVPAICQAYGKACTGSDTPCLMLTLDKWRGKMLLRQKRLRCPEGILVPVGSAVPNEGLPAGALIVKPVCADASEGIDTQSVILGDREALARAVKTIHDEFRQPALIEEFLGEREINVSILQQEDGVTILPLAEIDFSAFGPDRPRLVGYTAKWLPDSFEYKNTPRIIPAPVTEAQAEAIRKTALEAWTTLDCSDYGRVDLRLTRDGQPVVLEVNANPDISPDAGFVAALSAAKISYEDFVKVVIQNAQRRLAELSAPVAPVVPTGPAESAVQVRRTEQRDREPILALLQATAFFQPNEIEVAKEVLDDALARGSAGHYQSFAAEHDGETVGWVCFGPTPLTLGTFDIYWLAIAPRRQRLGIGKTLMNHAEDEIRARKGRIITVETSGRATYDATRRFYKKLGYQETARVRDFYSPGDDKVIYMKAI